MTAQCRELRAETSARWRSGTKTDDDATIWDDMDGEVFAYPDNMSALLEAHFADFLIVDGMPQDLVHMVRELGEDGDVVPAA